MGVESFAWGTDTFEARKRKALAKGRNASDSAFDPTTLVLSTTIDSALELSIIFTCQPRLNL